MRISCRWLILLTFGLSLCLASGCRLFSKLPETTWKLNRGPALDEGQGYFSIADPVPATDN